MKTLWNPVPPHQAIEVYDIDAPAWIEWGYLEVQPQSPEEMLENPIEPSVPEPDRIAYLQSLSWQELSAMAERYGLTKPDGLPWKEFAPEIADYEKSREVSQSPP